MVVVVGVCSSSSSSSSSSSNSNSGSSSSSRSSTRNIGLIGELVAETIFTNALLIHINLNIAF